jgi:hypothetical protein
MIPRKWIKSNKVSFAIIIFLLAFGILHMIKPSICYNKDGGFRPFGVGYKHKTVVPIWVIAILLAIFSYLLVLVI